MMQLRLMITICMLSAMTRESYVQAVLSCLELFTQDEIIVKLILGVDRRNSLEEAMETVDLAIKYQQMGIVGVDLCGNPSVSLFYCDKITICYLINKAAIRANTKYYL